MPYDQRNGREVMLQDLNAGLSAMLMPRDLTAIFDLKGVAEPASGETEAFVPAMDRRSFGLTISFPRPTHIVARIGQRCIRIARTFRQVAAGFSFSPARRLPPVMTKTPVGVGPVE
jgi:hypothetical protein